MEFAKIDVEVRTSIGKNASTRTRAAGRVPGVLYGHKKDSLMLALDPRALIKALDKEKKRNTVFTLNVTGTGGGEQVMAMIKEAQIDPISQKVLHVDFIRISMDEEVRVTVPIILKGTPVGVTNGGTLHYSMHMFPVAAKPDSIPVRLEVDVSKLDIGDVLHVSDMTLPAGMRSLLDPKSPIASVVLQREVEVEAAAATAVAGADGAAAAVPGKEGEAAEAPGKDGAKKADAKGDAGKKPDAAAAGKKPEAGKKPDAKK